MYARSTHATPVTRHVPLLLTVLVSVTIHVLLLAAGWAFIRSDQPVSQDSRSLSVVLGDDQAASVPAPAPGIPETGSVTETPALAESSIAPEAASPAEPADPAQPVNPAELAAPPIPPADPDSAPVETASVPRATADPVQVADQLLTTTADARLAVQADRRVDPSPTEADLRPQPNATPPESRMLAPQEQARVQQALDQLAELDLAAASLTGETISLADGSQFAVAVQAVSVPGLTQLASYEVTLSQRQDGRIFSIRAIVRERAFSFYAKFINRWDTDVVLASDTVIGRFHSNSAVNFSTDRRRQPVFSGPVSLAGYQGISRRLHSSGMFQQGIETGSGFVAMPDAVVPTVFTLAEESLDVHRFREHTSLTFLADGGVGWSQAGSRAGVIRPAPGNAILIVADDNAVLALSGVVSGVVSVFAPQRLSITGNLTYAAGQADNTDQQHFLTLISNGIIEVAGPAQTQPGDLQIEAALFARQRFSVRRFNSRPQGELIIRGTLVAGSVSATEPRYTTRIEYDPRFESMRPPAFPTTGLFDLEDWDRQWQITAVSDESSATAPGRHPPVAVE